MSKMIYLDNNATTKVDNEVLNAMLPYFQNEYANPSNVYSFSKKIKEDIAKARLSIARLINANSNEIIFTSCASESNNTAIMSAVRNNPNKHHLITTCVEHSSILETMKYLESIGYDVTYLSVDSKGRINLEELRNSIRPDTLLISIMFANNEIGNIFPIKDIGNIAKQYGILFHVDAVQIIGKARIDVKAMNIDTLSLSGHKIYAPKGVGVLYVKNDTPYTSLIFGGHQEQSRRAGTENVAYIVGLGKAADIIMNDNYKVNIKISSLRDYMEKKILDTIPNVTIYGDLYNRVPNTSSISFSWVQGKDLLFALDNHNICVSTGSACSAGFLKNSHVLEMMHADLTHSSPIRISLGKYNTKEEIDYFTNILIPIIKKLRIDSNISIRSNRNTVKFVLIKIVLYLV